MELRNPASCGALLPLSHKADSCKSAVGGWTYQKLHLMQHVIDAIRIFIILCTGMLYCIFCLFLLIFVPILTIYSWFIPAVQTRCNPFTLTSIYVFLRELFL